MATARKRKRMFLSRFFMGSGPDGMLAPSMFYILKFYWFRRTKKGWRPH